MKKIMLLLLVGIGMWQISAYAEWVNARIVTVDDQNDSILIQRLDDRGTPVSEQVNVSITKSTKYSKDSSINDLQAGAEIKLDLQQDADSGMWQADEIQAGSMNLNNNVSSSDAGATSY